MSTIQYIHIENFKLKSGLEISPKLSFQCFGKPIGKAPIVLVNHALTGNSQLTGKHGWWSEIVGDDKVINTKIFTVLAFNCIGNGFTETNEDYSKIYKSIVAYDIAKLFISGLEKIGVFKLFAIVGASVGGGITWHMAAQRPHMAEFIIPIATDWKSTNWIVANCKIQDNILNHSIQPIKDARIHAMTIYRTPESLTEKFNQDKQHYKNCYEVENWLNHHGDKLKNRFTVSAYKLMNQILKTINVAPDINAFTEIVKSITSHIHIITIKSDLLFKPEENWKTFVTLKSIKKNVTISEIKSIDGHDAFLIEHKQVSDQLSNIFKITKNEN